MAIQAGTSFFEREYSHTNGYTVEIRRTILAILLLGSAIDSSSLTLGRLRGAAIVGQPLDITVQAQLSPDENAGSLCAEADVFHADTRQDASRVRVNVDGGQSQTANIRITSSVPVDEPVVTVYLKVGCSNQKISRRFVMLADVPSEPVAAPSLPVVAAPIAAAPQAPVSTAPSASTAQPPTDLGSNWAAAQPAPPVVAARTPALERPKRPPPPPKPRPAVIKKPAPQPVVAAKPVIPAPAPVVADVPPVAAPKKEEQAKAPQVGASAAAAKTKPEAKVEAKVEAKPATSVEPGQSRLKLDPMLSLAERVTTLEATTNQPVVEALRDAQRVQTLEESVKTLVALAAKNEASMMDMRNRLQKAESDRVPMAWLYGLGGLLAASLGGLAYLLMRQKGQAERTETDDWWSASRSAPTSGSVDQSALTTPPQESVHGDERSAVAIPAQRRELSESAVRGDPESEMDVSLVEMSESNFDSLMRSGQAHGALRRGPLPAPTDTVATRVQPMEVTRSINSEQIFDVRQQAEFFVSLGQTDQAVRILENRINESGESSPLLYLDLLKIFHSLGLKQDYHQFREDFNLLFNSRVPEFSVYNNEGRSLEEYPHILAHITALWPTPKAQMVIEASIFRDPLDDKSKPFDLAAFRDLLLLHAIAQSLSRGDSGISGLAPLSTVPVSPQRSGPNQSSGVDVDISLDGSSSVMPAMPPAGADLDLDLTDLVGAAAKPSILRGSEEETEFPDLLAPGSAEHLPPIKKEAKSASGADDKHYLDFERHPTMRYSLPKTKAPGDA
jgi:hypothetical protein